MYAVIETGGKQYRVELGTELEVDRLDVEPGTQIDLGRVLLVADGDDAQVGLPIVEGARVTADVLRQDRGEKIDVFKYRPKARRRVKKGHRAELTVVRVADIVLNGHSAAASAEEQGRKADAERAAAEKEAARKAAADQAIAARLAAEQDAVEQAEAEPAAKPKQSAKPKATKPSDAKPSATKAGAKTAKPAATKSEATSTPAESTKSTAAKTNRAPKGASSTKKDE